MFPVARNAIYKINPSLNGLLPFIKLESLH
jgi:hypothetical protein